MDLSETLEGEDEGREQDDQTNDSQNTSINKDLSSQISITLLVPPVQVQAVTSNGSQQLSDGGSEGSQEIAQISVTLSRENSTNQRKSLKRKIENPEGETVKERKVN
uniref:Uncharacterized protein n=1 Tax=Pyxicephalus adspersus TaxID=30357 RepID=A0AAV3A866_PYXAD|nr:TPA: hypothetical protein GDO54_011547 [Pyxicephalus adspersus]